jgi:HEPN domain-containing protein
MKPITSEWIAKAEGDFAAAQRELSATDHPNYDAEANISFPRTHDLAELLSLALSIEPTWTSMTAGLNTLSAFAVEYRYPGDSADLDEANEALQICKNVREVIRRALRL